MRRANTPMPEITLGLDTSGRSSSETVSPYDPWCAGSPRSRPGVEALLSEKCKAAACIQQCCKWGRAHVVPCDRNRVVIEGSWG